MDKSDEPIVIAEMQPRIMGMIGQISAPRRMASEIQLTDSLTEDLNVDSLSFIELIIEIENAFGLEFDDSFLLMEAYPNVKAVVDYVNRKLESRCQKDRS